MFSPDKIIHSFLKNNRKKSFTSLSWQKLFKEFFCLLYFQSHLLKHFYRPYHLIICINETTNLEVLNLLNVLTRKYSFIKLKQSKPQNINVDLEQKNLLGLNLNEKILMSNTCLLIGINPRYEGSKLNLKLRSRYLKGNFNVIQIGSLVNLTFSNTNLTSNTKILTSLVEGNNLFCQEFTNSLNPVLISNTEILKRKDSLGLTKLLNCLAKYMGLFSQSRGQNSLHILSPSLNSVGMANLNNLKTIKAKDLRNATGVYFINNSFSTSNIKKLLSLKLLNFFQNCDHNNRILITQTSRLDTKLIVKLKKGFKINNHLHLPNTVFFEASGTYLNTEGNTCKVTKVIKPLGQSKNDWQIIRKMFSYSKKNLFLTNFLKNNNVAFNSNILYYFKNYLGFQHYAVPNLNNLAFSFFKAIIAYHPGIFKFKPKQSKIYNSQIRF